jgi:S1-C subfamily serine protease
LYTYYYDKDLVTTDQLQSISVKYNQRVFFKGHNHGYDLKILAADREVDIALLGKEVSINDPVLKTFSYPLGDSKGLEWGSFVYVMGFPQGFQMITRGIVSRPVQARSEYFLIDAVFNEGFSGGIVLAIRDGVPNFELVGIGKSASGTFENVLVPYEDNYDMIYNPNIPYTDEVYVKLRKQVNYGITYAISTLSLRKFYKKHKENLEMRGYLLAPFFENND